MTLPSARPRRLRRHLPWRLLLPGALLFAAAAGAEPNTVVSTSALGTGSGVSGNIRWDRNARYAVFSSNATDLVPGQNTGGSFNVFLYDRIAGTLRLVSHLPGNATTGPAAGVAGDLQPQISADGKWVAYTSAASNLVSGQVDANGASDVFLWSRETDLTSLVSHRSDSVAVAASLASATPRHALSLSDDGRYLAYASSALNLIAGQLTNSFQQIYLYDRTTAASVLVSHAANSPVRSADGRSEFPAISEGLSLSADGRWVAFLTFAANLVDGVSDGNSTADVYLWDRRSPFASSLRLVSRQAGSPATAAGSSDFAVLASDGSAVAFVSSAANVEGAAGDTNGEDDVFRYDLAGDAIELVSHAAHGVTSTGNGAAFNLSMSADGKRIAFESGATNHVLLQVDTNNVSDVFQWQGGTITLMSHAAGLVRNTGNGASVAPMLAADGTGVAYASLANDLVAGVSDGNDRFDTFFRRRTNTAIVLISHVPAETATALGQSFATSVALGGAVIGFESAAVDLVAGDGNGLFDVFFHGSLLMADGFESGDLSAWSLHLP